MSLCAQPRMTQIPPAAPPPGARASEQELLLTFFDLAHQVTSVLDQDELFQKIHELVRRVIPFDAFAVYLLDEKRDELRIAFPLGIPGHCRDRAAQGGRGPGRHRGRRAGGRCSAATCRRTPDTRTSCRASGRRS